jgi:hypothetical protein
MEKTKFNIFKRLMALILVLISLTSALPIIANAGDAVFLETLINTDKYTYVANLTRDTKNKNKKYAYKYMNMAYLLGKGCTSDGKLENPSNHTNPNFCFQLNKSYEYSKTDKLKATKNAGDLDNGKAIDMFLLIEGYVKSNDVNTYITDDKNIADRKSAKNKEINKSKARKTASPLSYPGYYTETVTSEQLEYGQEKLTQLVGSLNGILTKVNDGVKFKSVADMVNKSILIRPDSNKNTVYIEPKESTGYTGYFIIYSDLVGASSGSFFEKSAGQANRVLDKTSNVKLSTINSKASNVILDSLGLPRANTNKELYAYVFPLVKDNSDWYIVPKEASMFVYAVPKGFIDIKNGSTVFVDKKFTDKGGETYDYTTQQGDVPWISIHMLSFYANNVYKHENISVSTYTNPESNLFTNIIVGLFNWILDGIRNVLGLASMEELIFNLGVRGSAAFNFGLMSENWWNVVLQYQLVFQAIAWVMLVCGFIKMLIDLNLSSINPQKRQSVYDTVQKFIVVGIGLVILIPCTQFLLECNNTLVELFASQIETSRLNMPNVSNAIVQILVGILWITILLYINFLYIMRSITVALLIASGPFFIATMAFSSNGKSSLFTSWAKELLANIFVQSVHAFVLSFLVQLLAEGTFLETFAIAISIIPITETFRGLIFAGAGSSTSSMATTAAGAMKKMGTSAVKAGIGVAGAVTGAISGGGGDGGGGGSGGGGTGGNGKGGNALNSAVQSGMASKLDKMANKSSAGAKLSDKLGGGKGAKALGGVVDAAGVAGLALAGAAAQMGEVADIVDGLGELALKGDYNAAGKAVESAGKLAGNVASNGIGTGKAASQASKNAKNRNSANVNKPNTTQQSEVGGAAQNMQNGTNASGGQLKTPPVTSTAQVGAVQTKDLSASAGATEAQSAQALKDFREANAKGNAAATNAFVDGRHGTQFSFTDKDGKQQQFFMDDKTQQSIMGTNDNGNAFKATGKDSKIDENIGAKAAGYDKGKAYTDESVGKAAAYQRSEMDISKTSVENRKAGLAIAQEAIKNKTGTSSDVKIQNKDGTTSDGKRFTYHDEKGNEQSFVMSNDAIKEASSSHKAAAEKFDRSISNGATPTVTHGASTYSTATAGDKAEEARAGMAALHGKNMGTYLDENGKTAGSIYEYQGQQIAVSNEQIANAHAATNNSIEKYTQEQMGKTEGAQYQQDIATFMGEMANRNGMKNVVIDLSEANNSGQYTDAAMAASIGRKTGSDTQAGYDTYTIGEGKNAIRVKVPMGMDQATSKGGPTVAQQILKTKGINQIKTSSDGQSLSYAQHVPENKNTMYVATKTAANGGVITQMNTNIGEKGGPQTWTSDGKGGGTMKFENKQAAMTYFQSSGSASMADHIGKMQPNETATSANGVQTFRDNGSDGFEVSFNGSALKDQGMSMAMHSNGKDLLVSSSDNQPKDPFRYDEIKQTKANEGTEETNQNNNGKKDNGEQETEQN